VSAPEGVLRLVERFDNNLEAYKSGRYNETQVRVDFIDPLMQLLGVKSRFFCKFPQEGISA